MPSISEAIVVIAPIRMTSPVASSESSPLRWSISARVGFSRPAAISGRRIVPPAKTVRFSPSPKRLAASSGTSE